VEHTTIYGHSGQSTQPLEAWWGSMYCSFVLYCRLFE